MISLKTRKKIGNRFSSVEKSVIPVYQEIEGMGGAPPNPLSSRILTYLLLRSSSLIIEELLDERASVTLPATQRPDNKLHCPVDGCLVVLKVGGTCGATSGIKYLFIIYPQHKDIVPKEGRSYPRCG